MFMYYMQNIPNDIMQSKATMRSTDVHDLSILQNYFLLFTIIINYVVDNCRTVDFSITRIHKFHVDGDFE